MFVIKMRPAPARNIEAQQSFLSCQNPSSRHFSWLALFFVGVSSIAVSGCGGVVALSGSSGTNTTDATNLVSTPSSLEFGSVSIGNSVNQKISLANKGSDSVQISELSLSSTAFRVDGIGKLPITLASGSSLSMTVHFSPNGSSDSTDQLSVITSSSSTPAATIKLHGKGSSSSAEISGLTCSEGKVVGSGSDSCTIITNVAAPSGGLQVHLSSNTSAIKVPASVTVPAGTSSVKFAAAVSKVSTDQTGVITATQGNNVQSFTISLSPPSSAGGSPELPEIIGLTCDDSKVTGAGSDSCTIVTNIAATAGGLRVDLSSNTSAIKVPASVRVPAGASSAKFAATVSKVSADQTGLISATQGSNVRSFTISLSPPTSAVGAPDVRSLSCANTTFTGAGKTTCLVSLSATSSRALIVALASTSSAVSIPASAAVPAGTTTASFTASVAAVGNAQTASISASVNGSSRIVSMQLNASKASAASLSLSTSSMQFGDVSVGTAVTKSVTLTSSGNAPVTVKSDSITGTGFTVSGGNFPSSLKPGEAVVLTVHFNPTAAGSATGQLAIASSAGTQAVSLGGTGTTTAPTLSTLSCSSTSLAGSATDSCKVILSGSAPKNGVTVSLASSSTNLKVPASVTIPATATSATFTADAAAVSAAQSVKLTATAGSTSTSISLQLSPAAAQLSVDATSVSFGAVILNQITTEVVTLTSVGKAAVTVQSVAVSGTGFSLSSVNLPATLNPGQTLLLTLVYKGTTSGSQKGQLTITSNSSTNPTLTVSLSAASTPHRVELNWNAPAGSSNPVSSYKVYRANGGTGSFAKIAVTGQTGYTDTSVQSGDTYDYYVTSVGSSGGESKPSNTFTVQIP
jgi:hypothetical protein